MDLSDALDDFPEPRNQPVSHPANPTWPGQPTNPTWPAQPTNPTWPAQPTNPTWPAQPTNPTWPAQPTNPTWPGQPGAPAWPGQPGAPSWPGQPGAPAWPGQPGAPAWPGQPGAPAGPGQPGAPAGPGLAPQGGPHGAPEPTKPLTVPFDMPLASGVYNKMLITINGEVKRNAKSFTVNISKGKDIALHLNTRFNEDGKQVIVRNSFIGNQWGQEERGATSFPFVPGKPFEIKILCTDTEYKVAVNDSHLLDFKHRIRELNQIKALNIYNDVILKSFNVQTLQ